LGPQCVSKRLCYIFPFLCVMWIVAINRKKALIICISLKSWTLIYSFYVSLFNTHKGQFYRIHVGIQSPEGFSSSHGILRRFSDFLKLCSDVSWGNCWHVISNIPSVANLLFQISSILNLRCFLPVTQNQLILSEYTITTYRK